MKDPIVVETHVKAEGTLQPIAFEWKGKRFIIESHGRRWEEDGIRYFLVMVKGNQVFELAHLPEDNFWFLSRSATDFKPHSTI